MHAEAFGDAAAIVPKKTKTPYVFAVIYDSEEGLKIQEYPTRPEARKFVNQIGKDKVVRAYKVSEVIELTVKTEVCF
jgi:hypothetical protein